MTIFMTLQNNKTNKKHDISDVVSDISWETALQDQPGKLNFKCIDDDEITFPRGSIVMFEDTGVGVFFGFVFTADVDDSGIYDVVCYDQMRYLQNKDIYTIRNMTSSQVFELVCQNNMLPSYKVVSPTTTILPPRMHDNATMFDIIDWGIGYEKSTNHKWYIIRDHFGVLEFVDIDKLAIPSTELILSDYNVMSYKYSASIDSDTYNNVIIMQENREGKKGKPVKSGGTVVSRDFGTAKSEDTINQWGLLQYFEKCDKHLNQAQLDLRAEAILSQKNRETTGFTLKTFGDLRVSAGVQVYIYMERVKKELPNYYNFLVTSCTHRWPANAEHYMELQVYMPQLGLEVV